MAKLARYHKQTLIQCIDQLCQFSTNIELHKRDHSDNIEYVYVCKKVHKRDDSVNIEYVYVFKKGMV